MGIRCASKAIIVDGEMILLNRCRYPDGNVYYDLPGGGQHEGETMTAALKREVMEETGYTVKNLRFAGVAEEIYTDPVICEKYPEYTHRLIHLFAAEADKSKTRVVPYETDRGMETCVWMPLDEAAGQKINPEGIAGFLLAIAKNEETVYLGSKVIEKFI